MAKDTRIFRVTKHGKTYYKTRTAVSGMFASYTKGRGVTKVEAADAEATSGWTDVTSEFTDPKPSGPCKRHPGYKGVNKPRYRWSGDKRCTCWEAYAASHPDYPVHSGICQTPAADPASCQCRQPQPPRLTCRCPCECGHKTGIDPLAQ